VLALVLIVKLDALAIVDPPSDEAGALTLVEVPWVDTSATFPVRCMTR
jgi:hypothetical protein